MQGKELMLLIKTKIDVEVQFTKCPLGAVLKCQVKSIQVLVNLTILQPATSIGFCLHWVDSDMLWLKYIGCASSPAVFHCLLTVDVNSRKIIATFTFW